MYTHLFYVYIYCLKAFAGFRFFLRSIDNDNFLRHPKYGYTVIKKVANRYAFIKFIKFFLFTTIEKFWG